jgi:uncharacterized alpha-E superfamily protein
MRRYHLEKPRLLKELGVVDAVIKEPLGGAHRDHRQMANNLRVFLRGALRELAGVPIAQLVEDRYEKFRRMGTFLEAGQQTGRSLATTAAHPSHGSIPAPSDGQKSPAAS